jgi:hypothetical protein
VGVQAGGGFGAFRSGGFGALDVHPGVVGALPHLGVGAGQAPVWADGGAQASAIGMEAIGMAAPGDGARATGATAIGTAAGGGRPSSPALRSATSGPIRIMIAAGCMSRSMTPTAITRVSST